MALVDTLNAKSPPLRMDADGVVRVGGTRVTLDTVVWEYENGASAEEVVLHYPTLDLVASLNQGYAGATPSLSSTNTVANDSRVGLIGVQLNVPLYLGGLIDSRVRQAVANQERTRQDLETARRSAQLSAQTAFNGVTSGVAQVTAFEQAVKSAQVSYDSTKLGLEVGVRTNLDVLNQLEQIIKLETGVKDRSEKLERKDTEGLFDK